MKRNKKLLLEESLVYNVYRVNLLFRRELIRVLLPYGLTPEQFQILLVINHGDGAVNQTDICTFLQKDKFTVSKIIKRLIRDLWIEKTEDPDDKRRSDFITTEKADALKGVVPREIKEHFDVKLHGFSEEEMALMLKLLQKTRIELGDL